MSLFLSASLYISVSIIYWNIAGHIADIHHIFDCQNIESYFRLVSLRHIKFFSLCLSRSSKLSTINLYSLFFESEREYILLLKKKMLMDKISYL